MSQQTCIEGGCEASKIVGRGLCRPHYNRHKWRGTLPPLPTRRSALARLLARTVRDPETGCWEWTGPRLGTGRYGQFWYDGATVSTHRASWVIHNGAIPTGMHVCHHCDNVICVNPEHLFLGSAAANIADKVSKARQARGIGHGRATITDALVREVRRRADAGERGMDIATALGLTRSHVSMIARRRTWKHVVG